MRSRLTHCKGLKLDPLKWQIVRDSYSLLDPTDDTRLPGRLNDVRL
jgi:hypothetical protein